MKDISDTYGEKPGTLFEDYIHPDLEKIAQMQDPEHLKILEVKERRAIRYYFQHRRQKTAFSMSWLGDIESAIARINQYEQEKANKRLVVFDNRNELYWAGLGIYQEPWCCSQSTGNTFSLERTRQT